MWKRMVLAWFLGGLSLVGLSQSKSYTGTVKYHMFVEGSENANRDSMKVVWGQGKIKTVFYLPDAARPGKVVQKAYIDDFLSHTRTEVDVESRTYRISAMDSARYPRFQNTRKFESRLNQLVFLYQGEATETGRAEVLGAINAMYFDVTDYFFYGVQPLVLDNRIVLEFNEYRKDHTISRIRAYDISPEQNTEFEFSLRGYRKK